MNKHLSIPIEEYKLVKFGTDDRIAKLTLKFMHDGINLNKSSIKLPVIKKAIDYSLNNTPTGIPILASFEDDSSDFKEHNDDEISIGCIPPQNNNIYYELDETNNKTYAHIDGYIWTNYSKNAIEILENATDMSKACSIEIEILEGHKDRKTGIYIITEFKFMGITLLGDKYQPGMKGSNVKLEYSCNENDFYVNKLKELNNVLNLYFNENPKTSTENFSENIENIQETKKEDKNMTKNKIAETFKLTVMQLYDELYKATGQETYVEEWCGESYSCCAYWLRDFDETYVYAYNCEKGIEVKVPYTMEGDTPTVDFANAVRIKYISEDWIGGEDESNEVETFSKTVKGVKETFIEAIKLNAEKVFSVEKEKLNEVISTKDVELSQFTSELETIKADLDSVNTNFDATKTDLDSTKVEYVEITKKFTALEEISKSKDTEIASLKVENENLNTFKLDQAKAEVAKKAELIFTENADLLSTEEIATFTKKLDECEDFKVFETEIQSFLFIKAKEKIRNSNPNMNFSQVSNINTPNNTQNNDVDRWATYSKEYKNK